MTELVQKASEAFASGAGAARTEGTPMDTSEAKSAEDVLAHLNDKAITPEMKAGILQLTRDVGKIVGRHQRTLHLCEKTKLQKDPIERDNDDA